jgi:hypothetical protein
MRLLTLAALLHLPLTRSLPPDGGALACWASRGFTSLPCSDTGERPGARAAGLFAPDGADFFALIDRYLASQRGVLDDTSRWPLDSAPFVAERAAAALAPLGAVGPLLPYVARLEVPPNSTVALYGDLHGSFHSLLRSLWAHADAGRLDAATLRTAPGFFMAFLGDFVDRGAHGVETLALLLALKSANPGTVVLVRGNHEDLSLNARPGDFGEELQRKLPRAPWAAKAAALQRVYDTLPMAVFVGGGAFGGGGPRHVQGCHGGLEVGVDPRPLLRAPAGPHGGARGPAGLAFALVHGFARREWADSLPRPLPPAINRKMSNWGVPVAPLAEGGAQEAAVDAAGGAAAAEWAEGGAALLRARAAAAAAAARWDAPGAEGAERWPVHPLETDWANGFLWADFIVDQPLREIYDQPGRGLAFGLPLTDAVLARYELAGVFRAHQHNNAPDVGPMLARVEAGGGAYVNWGGSGHATTLLSGAGTAGFQRDAHVLLAAPSGDPAGWALRLCSNAPLGATSQRAARAAVEGALGAGGEAACAGIFGAQSAAAAGFSGGDAGHCATAHEFTCRDLPWHPAAR